MMKFTIKSILIALPLVVLMACSEESVGDNAFGQVAGKVVTRGTNIPLPNVKISSSPVSTTIFSDDEGNFSVDRIQVGEYSFQAEAQDFQTAFEGANIVEGQTVNVVFELDSLNATNLAPDAPLLIAPKDETVAISNAAEFTWSSSSNDDDEITYTLEIRDGGTNEIQLFEELIDTTLTVETLRIGTNYFWQVTADDSVNNPVQSAISGFATTGGDSNRFLYVRNIDGNNVIFSASESNDDTEQGSIENELRLTGLASNSFRPIRNRAAEKIGFLRSVAGETHLFTMNFDGSDIVQVTNEIPVAGFRSGELEFAWYDNGARLYYPHFNKLYSIARDGSGNRLEYQVADSLFISEIATNPTNNQIVLKTNAADGYEAQITIVNPISDNTLAVVAEDFEGALGGLDFSADGNRVLFSRDVSEVQNNTYRQLDARIFEYSTLTDDSIEIETDKMAGTNDLDPKYSPDDGSIIYVNTSNDGISEKRIFRTVENDVELKELLFTDAFMPDWE